MQKSTTTTRVKLRGLARPISVERVNQDRVEELLELGRETVAAASALPLDGEAQAEVAKIYQASAERLTDRRTWALVGDQLLAWLTHVGARAEELARSRGDQAIRYGDIGDAARETHKISCSPYCPSEPPEEGVSIFDLWPG